MSDGMPGGEELHRLRNAINAACVALNVGMRLLERGDTERARDRLADADEACAECRRILHQNNN